MLFDYIISNVLAFIFYTHIKVLYIRCTSLIGLVLHVLRISIEHVENRKSAKEKGSIDPLSLSIHFQWLYFLRSTFIHPAILLLLSPHTHL